MLQRWVLLVVFYLSSAGIGAAQQLFPGQVGEALLTSLAADYRPAIVLSGANARDTLYAVVDMTVRDGEEGVTCVYTDHFVIFDCDPSCDPSMDVYNDDGVNGINLEHSWPQSMGAGEGNASSDMHHLFPTRGAVNSARGNMPFGEIADIDVTRWYYLDQDEATPPPVDEQHLWSKRNSNTAFQPRDEYRGDIARAMFYFYTMYGPHGTEQADDEFFEGMLETLLLWHVLDPPSDEEIERTFAIADYQTTYSSEPAINPFVVDVSLAERAYGTAEPHVFFASAETSISSSEGHVTIPVFTIALDESASVTVSRVGGSAAPGYDFSFTDQVLTFSPESPSATFTIALYENPYAGPVTVELELQNPADGLMLGVPSAMTLTILPPAPETVLVRYEFTDNTSVPHDVNDNVSATSFGISSPHLNHGEQQSATWNQGSGVPYVTGTGGWDATMQQEARNFMFTVTPEPGYQLILSQLDFAHRRTNAGPQQLGIQIGDEILSINRPLAANQTVYESFPFSPITISESTTIRIHGWAGGGGGGEFRLDDVTLLGEVIEIAGHVLTIDGEAGWRMLSAPVGGTTVQTLADANLVYGIPGEYPNTDGVNPLTGYDGATFTIPSGLEQSLVPGRGFIWYLWDTDYPEGHTPSPSGGTSQNAHLPFDLTFSGSPVVENYQVAFTEDERADEDNGWYLIGNPYAEDYYIGGITTSSGGHVTTFQHWDPTAGANGEYVALQNTLVGVAQGFFMEMTTPPTFPLTVTFGRVPIVRDGTEQFTARFALIGELTDSDGETIGVSDSNARVVFSEEATDGFDMLDASKLSPLSYHSATIALMAMRGDELTARSVDSRPIPVEAVTIPMAFSTWANGMDAAGTFTISLAEEDLPATWTVTLTDLETGTTVNLLTDTYSFSIESQPAIDADERFEITFTPPTVSDEDGGEGYVFGLEAAWPNPATTSTQVAFTLEEAGEVRLDVFDVLGRRVAQIATGEFASGRHVLPVNTQQFASGVYVVRLITGSKSAVQRVTVVR